MLEQLLKRLGQGGTFTYSELAKDLGISEAMLDGMLHDLARAGYVRSISKSCKTHCAACAMSGICAVGTPGQVWTLTEKGGRALCVQQ